MEAVLALDKSASATVEVPVVFRVMVRSPPESVTASLNPNVVLIASAVLYSPASVVDVADVIVGLVTSTVNELVLSAQSVEFPATSVTVVFILISASVAKPVRASIGADKTEIVADPAVLLASVIVWGSPIDVHPFGAIFALI